MTRRVWTHSGHRNATLPAAHFLLVCPSVTAWACNRTVRASYSPLIERFTFLRFISPILHSERYAAMLETRPIIKVIVGNFLSAAIDAQILKIVVEEVSPVSTSSSSAPHLLERKSCPAHGGSQLRTWDRSLGSQRCSSTWTEITKAPGTHLNPERRIFGQRSGERKRVTSLLLPPSLLHSVTSQ